MEKNIELFRKTLDEILGNGVSLKQIEDMENILLGFKEDIQDAEIQYGIRKRNYPRW